MNRKYTIALTITQFSVGFLALLYIIKVALGAAVTMSIIFAIILCILGFATGIGNFILLKNKH